MNRILLSTCDGTVPEVNGAWASVFELKMAFILGAPVRQTEAVPNLVAGEIGHPSCSLCRDARSNSFVLFLLGTVLGGSLGKTQEKVSASQRQNHRDSVIKV